MLGKRIEFDDRLLGKIHGCLAGVAVGDAFGMPRASTAQCKVGYLERQRRWLTQAIKVTKLAAGKNVPTIEEIRSSLRKGGST